MRKHKRGDRLRSLETEAEATRLELDWALSQLDKMVGSPQNLGSRAPATLMMAIRTARDDGNPVVLNVKGEEIIAIVGPDANPEAVWSAVQGLTI